MNIKLDKTKYEIVENTNETLAAFRHGEPWLDLTGDNLIYFLALQHEELKEMLTYCVEVMSELPTLNVFGGLAVFEAANELLEKLK